MSKLAVGVLIGLVLAGGFVYSMGGTANDINADQLCNANLDGGNWTATNVEKNVQDMTATITCESEEQTETIGVDIEVGQL